MRLSAFRRRDPVVCGPRRIVPDVLPMSTFKLSNPIQLLVLMKANDLSRLTFELALRLHASFSPEHYYASSKEKAQIGRFRCCCDREAGNRSLYAATNALARHRSACGMARRNRSVA